MARRRDDQVAALETRLAPAGWRGRLSSWFYRCEVLGVSSPVPRQSPPIFVLDFENTRAQPASGANGEDNPMARLLITTAGLGTQALELQLGVNHVGRDPDCEHHLPNHSVSSLHCELSLTNEGVYLRDCNSTNGTFLDGELVKEAWLRPGQQLRLGDVELRVESVDVAIAIPEIKREAPPPKAIQENGELYCARHPDRKIAFKCTYCTEVMCGACVHVMKRQGGQPLYLCRVCSHICERIEMVQEKKKRGFLGFLQDTVKLKFHR
jgi:hypothetical protein